MMPDLRLENAIPLTKNDLKLQKYRSILRIAALNAKTIEAALAAAVWYGELNYHNQDGLLADESLEEALFDKHFTGHSCETPISHSLKEQSVLHVVTETFDAGGHSRMLERILQMQNSNGDKTTVFASQSLSPLFLKRCVDSNVDTYVAQGSLQDRSFALISKGAQFSHIFLHIHPFDVGMALAARFLRRLGRRVYFVNHADERFSFGTGAADVVCEISGYGWRLTEHHRAYNHQHFLGIPITKIGTWQKKYATGRSTVLSIGQSYKFRPSEVLNYPAMASRMIAQTGCSFTIVGSTGNEPWWAAARKEHPGGFRFIVHVAHDDLKNIMISSTCYVDSFPVIGGTAFTEMAFAGMPAFGVSNVPIGYSVADKIRSADIEHLELSLAGYLLTGEMPYDIEELVTELGETTSSEAVKSRFYAALSGKYELPQRELMERGSEASLTYYRDKWLSIGKLNIPLPKNCLPQLGVRFNYIAMAIYGGDLPKRLFLYALTYLFRRNRWA